MVQLTPLMDDEPPPEFIAFVVGRLPVVRREAARLAGGDRGAPEIPMLVLTDLARHWRVLTWLGRLTGRDEPARYLDRRLTARAKQWREDQVYPVEVDVLGDRAPLPALLLATAVAPAGPAAGDPARPADGTLAQRLASLLPSTVRADSGAVADAEIAWVHAYRRYRWLRYGRTVGGIVLLVGWLVQFMTQFSAPA